MARIFVILGVIFCSFSSYAGIGTGKITGLIPYTKSTGEKIFFVRVESKQDSPACNTTDRFVVSDTEPSYEIVVSELTAAYHAKTNVRIIGLNSCNLWSNSEDIRYVCFGDIPC